MENHFDFRAMQRLRFDNNTGPNTGGMGSLVQYLISKRKKSIRYLKF